MGEIVPDEGGVSVITQPAMNKHWTVCIERKRRERSHIGALVGKCPLCDYIGSGQEGVTVVENIVWHMRYAHE